MPRKFFVALWKTKLRLFYYFLLCKPSCYPVRDSECFLQFPCPWQPEYRLIATRWSSTSNIARVIGAARRGEVRNWREARNAWSERGPATQATFTSFALSTKESLTYMSWSLPFLPSINYQLITRANRTILGYTKQSIVLLHNWGLLKKLHSVSEWRVFTYSLWQKRKRTHRVYTLICG